MVTARSHRLALVASAALLLGSCGEVDPTEVVLVVTSDLAVPGELDRVIVEVRSPEGVTQTAEADLTAQGLPRSLGLHNPDGPLGPYVVEAVGTSGGAVVARRRAVFDFRRHESLEIELPILEDCIGVTCLCNSVSCSTCVEGGVCANAIVDPSPFDGVARDGDGAFELDLDL